MLQTQLLKNYQKAKDHLTRNFINTDAERPGSPAGMKREEIPVRCSRLFGLVALFATYKP